MTGTVVIIERGARMADFTHLTDAVKKYIHDNEVSVVSPYTPMVGGAGWPSGKENSSNKAALAWYAANDVSVVPQWENNIDDIVRFGPDKFREWGAWTARWWHDQGCPVGVPVNCSIDTDVIQANLDEACSYDDSFWGSTTLFGYLSGHYADMDLMHARPSHMNWLPGALFWSRTKYADVVVHAQQSAVPGRQDVDAGLCLAPFQAWLIGGTPAPTPAPAPIPAPIPAPTPHPVHSIVHFGARGADVTALQNALNHWAGRRWVTVDGKFGFQTQRAVMVYQKAHHLVADGIVGPRTWALLVP